MRLNLLHVVTLVEMYSELVSWKNLRNNNSLKIIPTWRVCGPCEIDHYPYNFHFKLKSSRIFSKYFAISHRKTHIQEPHLTFLYSNQKGVMVVHRVWSCVLVCLLRSVTFIFSFHIAHLLTITLCNGDSEMIANYMKITIKIIVNCNECPNEKLALGKT